MSSTDETIHNIEQECHYLTQALKNLKQNTPEYVFLNTKLEAAQEELEAMRQDQEFRNSYPVDDVPPPVPPTAMSTIPSPSPSLAQAARNPYDAVDDGNGNIVWNSEADDNDDYVKELSHQYFDDDTEHHDNKGSEEQGQYRSRSPLYDNNDTANSYEDDPVSHHTPGSGRTVKVGRYRDNPDDHQDREDVIPGSTVNAAGVITGIGGGGGGYNNTTRPKRKILPWLVLGMLIMISFFLFLLLKGSNSNSNSNSNSSSSSDGGVNQKKDNTGSGEKFTEPCASFSMHLIPDQFGNETSWKIIRYDGVEASRLREVQESQGTLVLEGGPYSYRKGFDSEEAIGGTSGHYEMVHASTCLPIGSYTFILYDATGDGICCSYGQGKYGINLSKGRVIRPLSNGKFAAPKEVTPFQVTAEDINHLPPTSSSSSSSSAADDNAVANNNIDSSDGVSSSSSSSSSTSTPSLDTNSKVTEDPCASFSMHLIPDQFGNETTWKIARYDGIAMSGIQDALNQNLGTVLLAGGPYKYKKEFDIEAFGSHYEMVHASTCLPVGVYTFILYDSKGDGICCDYGRGEYGIDLSKGRVVRPLSSGKFSGPGQVTPFEVTTEDIDVIPALSSIHSDQLDELLPNPNPGTEPEGPEEACASFSMHLVPDQFGNETSWKMLKELTEEEGGTDGTVQDGEETLDPTYFPTSTPAPDPYDKRFLRQTTNNLPRALQAWSIVLSGGPYSYKSNFDSDAASSSHYNAIIAETCLPIGSYKFTLNDVDGICCDYGRGEYGINLSKGRVVRPLSPGKFKGGTQTTSFEVTADDVDVFPAVTSSPGDTITNTNNEVTLDTSSDHNENVVNEDPISSSSSSVVETIVEDTVTPSLVTNRPMSTTSINSLNSLVTVPSDSVIPGRGKSYGILFDVQTTANDSPLVITGMDLYLDTQKTSHYEIWTKAGSWQDVKDSNPDYFAGFRQVSHGSITGKGASDFTKIALRDFQDVTIQGGSRQAFWVTLSDNNMVFQSYEGEGISRHEMGSAVQATKDELEVYYGTAVRAYPLEMADPETDFWYNAGFLGRLWFKQNSSR